MKLNIPYFSQEHVKTCGIAALRIVLGYHDDLVSEKELVTKIKLHNFGTFSTDLGSITLKRGYKVKSYTMHLSLLGPLNLSHGTKITQDILKRINISPKDKMTFESWQNYLQNGGELIYDFPKIEQIIENLQESKPSIISVNTAVLGNFYKHWNNSHILVVNGFKNNEILVLDPQEGERTLNKDLLFTAWITNAFQSSSHLLIIEK